MATFTRTDLGHRTVESSQFGRDESSPPFIRASNTIDTIQLSSVSFQIIFIIFVSIEWTKLNSFK